MQEEGTFVGAAEGLLAALEWNWTMVDAALDGLDEATLARCPAAQCNSIAWTLWHMNRVVDTFIRIGNPKPFFAPPP
jgi:hypothetical protein